MPQSVIAGTRHSMCRATLCDLRHAAGETPTSLRTLSRRRPPIRSQPAAPRSPLLIRLPQQARRELDAPVGKVLHGRQAEYVAKRSCSADRDRPTSEASVSTVQDDSAARACARGPCRRTGREAPPASRSHPPKVIQIAPRASTNIISESRSRRHRPRRGWLDSEPPGRSRARPVPARAAGRCRILGSAAMRD